MHVCFTSDLHGDRELYDQLAELLRRQRPDLLVLGGDLLRDVDPSRPAGPQVAAINEGFAAEVDTWLGELPDLKIACVLGNHELVPNRDGFRELHDAGKVTLLDHERDWSFAGYHWLGYGCAPPSPHWAKDFERLDRAGDATPEFAGVVWDAAAGDLREVDLALHFQERTPISDDLAAAPAVPAPFILVAHAPPRETHLDRLPQVPYPIGSRGVRDFIETRQPMLSLHGHVHESPNVSGQVVDRIGDTLCVNPGQSHNHLHAVLFDLDRPGATLRHTVLS